MSLHDIRYRSNNYLCLIVLFIDGSHCDRNSRIQSEPVLCSIGNINMEKRTNPRALFLGLLPNKMLSPAERRLRSRDYGLHTYLLNLYHSALRIILFELIEIQQNYRESGAGMQFVVHGK